MGTPPLPPPSLTWTPPLCCPVVLLSVASTPLSTPSTPPPVSWTPTSSELSTTELPVMSRSCCRTTSPSRISLLSWVWMSCLRRTRSRSPGRKVERFLSQPFQVAEVFTNNPGKLVPIAETISGFSDILAGKYDQYPEVAFYMVGNIDEVVAK